MLDIRKWNYETHEYDPYEVPADKTIVIYTQDMDMPIDCANCFKGMTFGQGYTSRTLHTHVGLGYPVCEDCYEEEINEERKAKSN